jgi:hypothetical protein
MKLLQKIDPLVSVHTCRIITLSSLLVIVIGSAVMLTVSAQYLSAVTRTSANKTSYPRSVCQQLSCVWAECQIFHQPVTQSHDKGTLNLTNINLWTEALTSILKNIHTQNLRTW